MPGQVTDPSRTLDSGESSLPLCVDLDGTLLLTDTFYESAVAVIAANPLLAVRFPGWLASGKARLKRELAERWNFDPATLPYNAAFLDYLRAEHAAGRRLVLCTAAHHLIAQRVAEHLALFDEVIASDGETNLRGTVKAAALVARFGHRGFVYAGNDRTDEAVWDVSAGAIVVNAAAGVHRRAIAKHRILMTFDRQPGSAAGAAIKAMRPYQWVKNALCLVPVLAASDFDDAGAWLRTFLVIGAFCLIASSIYMVNDLSDLAADRAHARKRRRPFAAGALPIPLGLGVAAALLACGTGFATASGALPYVAIYAVASVSYSMWLKEQPLVDVFMLAFLYTIRLFGGGVASGHQVSLWLLGFSSFLFLSLALVKRSSELVRHTPSGGAHRIALARRGYMAEDSAMLQMFGCASTFASIIVLSLYVQSDVASRAYAHPQMLWGCIPLLLFWQCRLWLSTARGYMDDDPIVYAARDWVSWLVFVCLGVVVLAALTPIAL
jgi:4-hydroxybenzoate polyprenyltransferase